MPEFSRRPYPHSLTQLGLASNRISFINPYSLILTNTYRYAFCSYHSLGKLSFVISYDVNSFLYHFEVKETFVNIKIMASGHQIKRSSPAVYFNFYILIIGFGYFFHVTVKSPYYMVYCNLGAVSIRKTVLPGMAIPMLKIRRPNGRLIFNMEIAIHR